MRGACSLRQGVAPVVVVVLLLRAAPAWTQGDDDLDAARKLFREAVADEDAKRYETALEKFRRVDAQKDTANVRYRIATCLEALGHRAEALANYDAVVRLGNDDKTSADAVRVATARVAQLDPLVPRLSILLPASAPSGTVVSVDDVPVDGSALSAPMALDPGHHSIAATAPGAVPFRTGVTLAEGARVSISVALEPANAV